MKKIFSKTLAVMLAITLTFANFILVATYAVNVNYEEQKTNINKTDVSFDAYFVSEEGVKSHTGVTEINNDKLKLFLSVSVTQGYLKNAKVIISNSNFKLVKGEELPSGVEGIDVENGTVTLNQINKGEAKEIELQIEVVKDEKFNLSNFAKDVEVKLNGTFVNNDAKEIPAEKTITVNLALSENAESNLTAQISKYSIFEEAEKKKALLQLMVSSKVIDNLLPVKSTEINIEVPKLFEKEPESVSVTSASTKATNGDNGTLFNDNNYTYSNGNISIKVSNEADANNEINWVKNSEDQYIINLIYNIDDENNNKIQLKINSKLSLYNNEEKEIINEINEELEIPQATEGVVSYAINNETSKISKGYMLVKNAGNTEYKQEIKVNIGYNPTVNNIEINKDREYYTDINGNAYTATTYYKEIKVNAENLVKILGEDGTLEILENGVKIGTLNKDMTSYKFEKEISNVTIIISKPIADGILTIETDKYIKSAEYNEGITNNINKITTSIEGKTGSVNEKVTTEIELVEPTLQIVSSINNSNLSTVIENENVEMKVSLQTNNNTNRLFKNPVIEIELPSYIKEIKVKTINILYNEELVAKTGNIITNNQGNKVIRIALAGEQTKFNDILSVEGTTLIIGANITVDKTAPSTTQKINVKVTNNNKETVETSSNITYMAPTGIITLNSISGYNSAGDEITSISGEKEVGQIVAKANAKVATETITIINNNDYTCGNVTILGRTPSEGNKSVSTGNDLGSTFTAKMVNEIKAVEGVDNEDIVVYYSENENATNDLSKESNGWTASTENLENVKSYLIVVEQSMVKGDKLVFSYDIEIPGGLEKDKSTYSIYQVSYTNLDGALSGVMETALSPMVGLSTEADSDLKVELSSNVQNGADVKEGQIIEYKIKVTNVGRLEAKDITVSANIPNGSYYTTIEYAGDIEKNVYETDRTVKTYTDKIENLAVGASVEKTFLLTVGNKVDRQTMIDAITETEDNEALLSMLLQQHSVDVEVKAVAEVINNGETLSFDSNTLKNPKTLGYFKLDLSSVKKGVSLKTDNIVKYTLDIEKLGEEGYHNLVINCNLPQGLKYKSSTHGSDIKEEVNGQKLTWKVENFSSSKTIQLYCEIEDTEEERTIALNMSGTCDEYNGTITSNTESFNIGKPKLEISHSSNNTSGNLTEGDEITYILTVKNTSNVTAYNVKVTDYVSDGLYIKSLKYKIGNNSITRDLSGETANIIITILENETLVIEIKAISPVLKQDEEKRTVSNRFEVISDDIDKITSNTLEHIVNKKIYKADKDNGEITTSYSISGLAWLDENKNGIRDVEEKLLPEISVKLINETGEVVASGKTNEKGEYIFSNLSVGKYIVAFIYDTTNYDVTAYGLEDTTLNNDTVPMKVNIGGETTSCAATNVINLNSNMYNIDLGLIISPKFELSLSKTISQVSVQTSKGTTINTYDNPTVQKIEIPSKYLNGAIVAIEYEIKVTNTGAVAGYASKIVDYLSSTDLNFNSETNKDWYLGTDGDLYNSSLKDKLLQPGESATLKLVLTKQVTEKNTGLTNNTAEIYEAYNDAGVKENFTPGNKSQNEKDLGQADIIITPKTGEVFYIGSVIIFMASLAVGIYILNKKVIQKM